MGSSSSKIVEAVVEKLQLPRTSSKIQEELQIQQVVSAAEEVLQEHYDYQGVPRVNDLSSALYNPQQPMMEGYQAVAKMKNERVRQKAKIQQVLRVVVIGITYKLIRCKFEKLPKLHLVLKVILAAKLADMMDTIRFEVCKCTEMFKFFEFTMSKTGGNQVGTLLKILEKASYVELRIQDPHANYTDVQRHISCLQGRKHIYQNNIFQICL